MNRRHFLMLTAAAGVVPALARAATFEVTHTDAQWRAMLTKAQYNVMRRESTEPAGSSPLDKVYDNGTYLCRGCELPLYSSETKYDSGTGWPSFWKPIDGAVATKADWGILGKRTEVHCRRCGSHLGHVFNDGPKPTGKRHCLNGVSLVFVAA